MPDQRTHAMIQLYVDDLRPIPEGYRGVRTVLEAIEILRTGQVSHLDLDHDMGEWGKLPEELVPQGAEIPVRELTGMTILEWMAATGTWPEYVGVHTANYKAAEDMHAFLRANDPRYKWPK
jgi:hypothetical protein